MFMQRLFSPKANSLGALRASKKFFAPALYSASFLITPTCGHDPRPRLSSFGRSRRVFLVERASISTPQGAITTINVNFWSTGRRSNFRVVFSVLSQGRTGRQRSSCLLRKVGFVVLRLKAKGDAPAIPNRVAFIPLGDGSWEKPAVFRVQTTFLMMILLVSLRRGRSEILESRCMSYTHGFSNVAMQLK